MTLFLYLSNLVFGMGIIFEGNDAPTWVYLVCLFVSNILFFIADALYDKDKKNKNT